MSVNRTIDVIGPVIRSVPFSTILEELQLVGISWVAVTSHAPASNGQKQQA